MTQYVREGTLQTPFSRNLRLAIGEHPTQQSNTRSLASGIQTPCPSQKAVRVLAFLEARRSTTGPAKNLLEVSRRAVADKNGKLKANIAIATFTRGQDPTANEFTLACEKAGLEIHFLRERFRFDLAVVPAIRKLIALCQPDIIESHAVKSHFLIRLSGISREHPLGCISPWIHLWTDPRNPNLQLS